MQKTAHHIGSSCQQRKQKNWNHHLYFYISMYIHYMIHVSINFPPSRKMHMKHFSRFTGLAIWAYSFFFQFFRCLHLPSFLPLIFTHKTPKSSEITRPAWYIQPGLKLNSKNSLLNIWEDFTGMKFPSPRFFCEMHVWWIFMNIGFCPVD